MQTIVQIRFILFFLCCCLLNIGFSQSARAFISSLENPALADEIRPTISDFDLLAIDRGRMQSIAKDRPEQMQLTIPFEGETMVVSLHAVNIFGDDFQVLAGTKQVAQRIDYQGGALYRGEIKGKENSLVAISFFENELFGVLADQNGNINFGLLPDQPERGPLRAIIYREQAHNFPPQFTCEADNLSTTQVKPKKAPTFSPFAAKQMNSCFQNYLEGDYDLYLERNSNVTNATNWIVGMWNVVATIYDNEQLTAAISEIFIWTSPDPYGDDSSSSALSDFRSRMSNGFNGDLAHLISRNDQDNSGGLAYINVICNPNNGLRTAFSNIWSSYNQLPDYSWTVNVLAHETGHNVGSPHTHNCSWNGNGTAIDGCGTQWGDESGCPGPLPNNGGTVMSYCHLIGSVGMNLSLGFGPQPGDLIRGRVGACSNCNPQEVEGCTDPSAHNYNPLATIDDGSCETCTDGIQNGNETGVDCGGICTPCPCFDNTVEIRLNFDDYPEETRWEIANSFGGVIASGGTYPGQPDGSSLTEFVCLTNGCYSFTIFDSAADGLCCGYGIGSYSVVGPNGTVASGAEFGASETTSFCLNEDAQPSCDDGIQNGNETGVDCGGPDCLPCAVPGCTDPEAHNYNPDATVDDGSCETCTDGIQNGDETGVDCGGSLCQACSTCDDFIADIYFGNNELEVDRCPGESAELIFQYYGEVTPPLTIVYRENGVSNTLTDIIPTAGGTHTITVFPTTSTTYQLVGIVDDEGCINAGFEVQEVVYNVIDFPTPNPPTDLADCESVTLPPITGDNLDIDLRYYRLASNNTQLSPGTQITNSGDYFLVVDRLDCITELPFTITIGGPSCQVEGCTDPEAHNYNPDATVDDGSCETCTDGIQNGDETGVDCGGSLCQACSTCDDFIADIYFGNNELEVDRCPGGSAELIFQYYGEVTPPLTIVYRENGVSNTLTDIIPTAGGTHTITVFPTTSTTYQLVGIVDAEGCVNAGFEVQEVVYNVIDFPTPNPPTDLADCESVTLPPITGDNLDIDLRYYRLASNNNQLSPGTQITTSGDYFLVVDRLGCITELPFSITIGGPNCQVVGCTDPEAHNYNPDATVDDGSCETCTDGIQNGDETGIDCGGILCEVCPNDSLPDIGGYLLTEMGDSIAEITVAIASNTDTLWLMTDSVGNYTGPDLNPDSSYVIYPVAPPLDTNGNMASNGVSILDILMIQQQILAASDTAILSPYQMIAADVDGNGQISLIDIIASVQVILGQSTTFPIGVSWRFIDADYVFPEPYNPWYEPFPEYRLVDTVKADTMTNNFIGIKMGDLNASASAGLAPEPSRSLTLSWEDATFKAGEMITLRGQLPVSAGPQDLSYFEVSFSDALEWSGELRVAGQKPLSVDDREAGKLRFIWANLANQVQENEVQIRFRARKNGRLSQAILPNDRSLWLQKNGTYFRIKTEISPQITPQTAILEAVKLYPNPSNGLVELVLPATTVADEYQLQLLDLNGRVLQQLPLTVTDGTQRYRLDFRKNGSITSGTYVLRIQSQASRHYFRLVFR